MIIVYQYLAVPAKHGLFLFISTINLHDDIVVDDDDDAAADN